MVDLIDPFNLDQTELFRRDIQAYLQGQITEDELIDRGYKPLFVLGVKWAGRIMGEMAQEELAAEDAPGDPGSTLTARQRAALLADQIERSRRLNATDPVTDERWTTNWTPCASEEGE